MQFEYGNEAQGPRHKVPAWLLYRTQCLRRLEADTACTSDDDVTTILSIKSTLHYIRVFCFRTARPALSKHIGDLRKGRPVDGFDSLLLKNERSPINYTVTHYIEAFVFTRQETRDIFIGKNWLITFSEMNFFKRY